RQEFLPFRELYELVENTGGEGTSGSVSFPNASARSPTSSVLHALSPVDGNVVLRLEEGLGPLGRVETRKRIPLRMAGEASGGGHIESVLVVLVAEERHHRADDGFAHERPRTPHRCDLRGGDRRRRHRPPHESARGRSKSVAQARGRDHRVFPGRQIGWPPST